jgi:hypothetical protein
MSEVQKFIDQTQFTVEVDGIKFRLRKPTPVIGLKVYGVKLLGLIAALNTDNEKRDKYIKSTGEGEREKHGREFLRLCMVSPRLGDVTNPDADTITYDDLEASGHAAQISQHLTGDGDPDFSKSCEDRAAQSSQDNLTPSDSDTEPDQADLSD